MTYNEKLYWFLQRIDHFFISNRIIFLIILIYNNLKIILIIFQENSIITLINYLPLSNNLFTYQTLLQHEKLPPLAVGKLVILTYLWEIFIDKRFAFNYQFIFIFTLIKKIELNWINNYIMIYSNVILFWLRSGNH